MLLGRHAGDGTVGHSPGEKEKKKTKGSRVMEERVHEPRHSTDHARERGRGGGGRKQFSQTASILLHTVPIVDPVTFGIETPT